MLFSVLLSLSLFAGATMRFMRPPSEAASALHAAVARAAARIRHCCKFEYAQIREKPWPAGIRTLETLETATLPNTILYEGDQVMEPVRNGAAYCAGNEARKMIPVIKTIRERPLFRLDVKEVGRPQSNIHARSLRCHPFLKEGTRSGNTSPRTNNLRMHGSQQEQLRARS